MYSENEIINLIKRFEEEKLPKSEWTHGAHLIAGVWYLTHHEKEEAMRRLREKIKKHNASVGTPNSDTDGYHETITQFWVWAIHKFLSNHSFSSLEESCNALIQSKTGNSKLPLDYYSKELLFSVKARHEWVKPDLQEMVE